MSGTYALHLRSYFGDTPMKQVTTGAINRYIQELVVAEIAPEDPAAHHRHPQHGL